MTGQTKRLPCPECQAERDATGLEGIWCSSDDCYVEPPDEPAGPDLIALSDLPYRGGGLMGRRAFDDEEADRG